VFLPGNCVKIVNSRLAEIDVNAVENILTNSKYRDATGRVFGLVRLSFQNLISYLRRFLVPGFALHGKLIVSSGQGIEFIQYVSLTHIGEISIIDISPILYLSKEVDINSSVTSLYYENIKVSTDLLEYISFVLEPPQ